MHNTAKDISVMRGFAKSNVSKAVESLRMQRYLSSSPDPENRKVHRLILSADMKDRINALAVRNNALHFCWMVFLRKNGKNSRSFSAGSMIISQSH